MRTRLLKCWEYKNKEKKIEKTGRRRRVDEKKIGRQGAKVGEGEKIKDSNIEARQPNPKTPL